MPMFARRQWTFLRDGKSKGVPISPFLDMPAVVIKDKNEEVRTARGYSTDGELFYPWCFDFLSWLRGFFAYQGGMGLYFFKNATAGGNWIIQERLDNDAFVSSLLPENAPLSTLRVISASRLDRFLQMSTCANTMSIWVQTLLPAVRYEKLSIVKCLRTCEKRTLCFPTKHA